MATKYFMNGGVDSNWASATNWSTTSSAGPNNTTKATASDQATFDAGSPACTVSATEAAGSLIMTGYNNTITHNAQLTVSGNITWSATTTLAGTSTLVVGVGATTTAFTTSNKTYPGPLTWGGTGTKTLTGTLGISGLMTKASTAMVDGGTQTCAGGMQINGTMRGTSAVIWTGGSWAHSANPQFQSNLTVAGNVTISGAVYWSSSGNTFTYQSGTVTTTSSTFGMGQGTFITDLGGGSKITFANVAIKYTVAGTTLGSDLTLTGTLGIDQQTVTNAVASVNGAYKIYCSGNVNTTGLGGYDGILGTCTIEVSNGGTLSGGGSIGTSLIFNGNYTMSGTMGFKTGTMTYTSGTITTTSSTLNITGNCTLNTNGITWNIVSMSAGTATLSSNLSTGTFTQSATSCAIAGAYTLTCTTYRQTSGYSFSMATASTLTATTNLYINGADNTTTSLISSTPSTHTHLIYQGTNANQKIFCATLTDLDASGGNLVYAYQSTLLRTTNIKAITGSDVGGAGVSISNY
jgi:hypothetical protein